MQNRRYSFVPVLAVLLQIIAVLILFVVVYSNIQDVGYMRQNWASVTPTQRIPTLIGEAGKLVEAFLIPFVLWLFADLVLAARDIEFNTRVAAGIVEPEAEVEPVPAPAPIPPVTPTPEPPPPPADEKPNA